MLEFCEGVAKGGSQRRRKIEKFFWGMIEPPMMFYTMIKDLQMIAEAAQIPRTNEMLVVYGLEAIQKTGDLEQALRWGYMERKWMRKRGRISNYISVRRVRLFWRLEDRLSSIRHFTRPIIWRNSY